MFPVAHVFVLVKVLARCGADSNPPSARSGVATRRWCHMASSLLPLKGRRGTGERYRLLMDGWRSRGKMRLHSSSGDFTIALTNDLLRRVQLVKRTPSSNSRYLVKGLGKKKKNIRDWRRRKEGGNNLRSKLYFQWRTLQITPSLLPSH